MGIFPVSRGFVVRSPRDGTWPLLNPSAEQPRIGEAEQASSRTVTPPRAESPMPSRVLVSAIRKLLEPLVQLLLSQQITFPFLTGLLKEVYVEAADRDFALEGRRQTTSRVSLLTGIHRKDVKRLREAGHARDSQPRGVSLGALLVSTWTASTAFLDSDGSPLALPRQSNGGGDPSFESLVESVSKDIHPRAVLDEWVRLGVVEIDPQERVRLVVGAFVPDHGFAEKAFYFGENLHDHMASAVHNLTNAKPAELERRVHYTDLSPESVRELAELSESLGMQALQSVNRRARELKERDQAAASDASRSNQRMSFGVYFHREEIQAEGDDDA